MSTSNGRAGAAGPGRVRDDLASPVELVRTLLRYAGVILLATAAAAVLAAFVDRTLSDSTVTEHTAQARVGLTQEIQWPFYDAARDRQVAAIQQAEAVAAATAAAGVPDGSLTLAVVVPVNQAFVDVVATAPTAAAAVAGANAAADHLVAADVQRVLGAHQAELAATQAQLQAVDAAILSYGARLDLLITDEARLTAQLRAATNEQVEAIERGRLAVQLERSAVETYRDEAIRSRTPLAERIAELEREIGSVTPEVEILRYSAPVAAPAEEGGGVPRWALAAAAAFVVAAVGALVWDREYGRLHGVRQLRGATAIPALGELVVPRGAPAPVGRSAALCAINLHDRAIQVGARIIGIVELGGAQTDVAVRGLAQQLLRAGYTVATIGPQSTTGAHLQVPLEDLLAPDGPGGRPGLGRNGADMPTDGLQVAWSQRGTIHDVAYARDALAALAANYDVVLVDCGQSDQRAEAWWSRVRSCHAIVTVARVRRTRVSAVRRLVRVLEDDTPHLGVILLRPARPLAGRSSRPELRPSEPAAVEAPERSTVG